MAIFEMAVKDFCGLIVTGAALAGVAFAQFQIKSNPVDLPNGPAAPGFDIKRFSNAGNGAFETFYVQKTERLKDLLDQGRIAGDTRMLALATARGKLALITDQMAFHHIAEGTDRGKDWMAVF
jgi:hypothetical protein